jgi:hypothetical protein
MFVQNDMVSRFTGLQSELSVFSHEQGRWLCQCQEIACAGQPFAARIYIHAITLNRVLKKLDVAQLYYLSQVIMD